MTKNELMKELRAVYHSLWSLWDNSEKMIDSVERASDELVVATNQIESAKMALMVAYKKLGGDIRDL